MAGTSNKGEKIIAEFEELLKVKEFHKDENWPALEGTYQTILDALKNEFYGNIKDKLDRWIYISNARYFKYAQPVKYYFQAKMLFRDGYYEAAITLARSICEMICYDYLSSQSHPFGSYEDLEMENFRTLLKYLAIPKTLAKETFEKKIILKLSSKEDKNFLKSSYTFDKQTNIYSFKIENGKEAKNLNRFHQLFESVSYSLKENFPDDTFKEINKVYDHGNIYVHARKSKKTPKQDAISCLNGIGKVLAYLYIVKGELVGKTIVSGYLDFPDICKGMDFALDSYFTPEDAMRGYYNLPSQKQIDRMLTLQGDWRGEWRIDGSQSGHAVVKFFVEGEYLRASLDLMPSFDSIENLDIKLFGDYFHLIGYSTQNNLKEKKSLAFELEFLNNNTLIGQNLLNNSKTLFNRIEQ